MMRRAARIIPAQAGIQSTNTVIPAEAGTQGAPSAKRVSLLGAESTGKTRLANELAAHFRAQGSRVALVPEQLRLWAQQAGRMPRPEELLAIAQSHEQLVEHAAAGNDLIVSDAGALLVAIYGGVLFEDAPIYRYAIEAQARYHATLVTGLDLPWAADGLQRDAGQPREAVDALVRASLQKAGIAYQVVYGHGSQRLGGALAALGRVGLGEGIALPESATAAWAWSCEKCSDPECEHRLFRRLL